MICEKELQIHDLMLNYSTIYIDNFKIEDVEHTRFNFHDTNVEIDGVKINYYNIQDMYGVIDADI